MQHLPRNLVDKFAEAFAGKDVGFSAREITDYFTRYSNLVKPYDHYGFTPVRKELFIESVYFLSPKKQYYALNDLAFFEYKAKYKYPDKKTRLSLRDKLHNFISTTPIGLAFSQVRETAFREDWVACHSRLASGNVPSAITAARTMLETLLKTIITENKLTPDSSGDIGKLVKQAEVAVGLKPPKHTEEHQIFSGFASVINGLSSISNKAGDRHGVVGGKSINDSYFAELCINAAGTIGIAFIEMHLFNRHKKSS